MRQAYEQGYRDVVKEAGLSSHLTKESNVAENIVENLYLAGKTSLKDSVKGSNSPRKE